MTAAKCPHSCSKAPSTCKVSTWTVLVDRTQSRTLMCKMKCLQEALNRWLNMLFSEEQKNHKMCKAAQLEPINNNDNHDRKYKNVIIVIFSIICFLFISSLGPRSVKQSGTKKIQANVMTGHERCGCTQSDQSPFLI